MTVMAACFFYLQVFVSGMPGYVFWLLSLLSQPAFAMAIDYVSSIAVSNDHDMYSTECVSDPDDVFRVAKPSH